MIGIILTVGASFDQRQYARTPVFKEELALITIPDGDANEWTGTVSNLNGIIRQVTVVLNNNTNDVTTTIEIRDPCDSVIWTETGAVENTKHVFQYNTRSGTDLPMALPFASEDVTIGITPSGDPGASTLTARVVIWGI
jgi:hypothetical protein